MKFLGLKWGIIVLLIGTVMPLSVQAEEHKDDAELTNEIYIDIPPVTVTMYHKGRPKGNMTVKAKLKVIDEGKRALAQKYLPRLSNAYVIESNRLSNAFFDVNRPVNIVLLGNSLQKSTDKILGHADARLLISDVVVNKR